MHKYLRAVGFSEFEKKSQLDEFFNENLKDENLVSSYMTQDMRVCGQYNLPVCNGAGIAVIGEQEENQSTFLDFYFPYLKGYDYTLIQECTIERHSDKDSYACIINDYRFEIALIFYMTNGNVYNSIIKSHNITDVKIDKIFLSALSISGRVILPIENKELSDNEFDDIDKINQEYDDFLDDEDDEDEFDDLDLSLSERLLDDIEDFSEGLGDDTIGAGIRLSNNYNEDQEDRLNSEDLYSIVETSLVPYGIECDKYQIVAEILSVNRKINEYTGEVLIEMRVDTMGLEFNLMINENDLDGEPIPGRRFRGVIWLLGEVEFLTKYEAKDKE